ncbi:pilus assembly protein TadG-related protein [Pseudomonas sp. X10]
MVPRSAARQRGAIGLTAALTLGLALLFLLLVVDSGRLYLEQRKLQRVADMAALEAAGQSGGCGGNGPQADALARTSATRNGFAPDAGRTLATRCGYLQSGTNSTRIFTSDNTRHEAIQVQVSHDVTTSVAAGVFALAERGELSRTTTLRASAVAAAALSPQAVLRIGSTTVNAKLLDALLDALGIGVELGLVGWEGIATTQINLLQYLDQLAIEVGADIGGYQQLLQTQTTLTELLHAAAKVLERGGAAVEVVANVGKIADASVGLSQLPLTLGDILDIQTGTTRAGLDANLQLLQLLQAVIQLATKEHAADVELPIAALGLINGRVRLKIIEPQQISAVGDPGKDTIEVHTAQVRALVSLDLPLLTGIAGLLNAVLDLAAPLTNVLNNLLHLNLLGTVQSLTCALGIPCKVSDIIILPGQVSLDIGVQVAKARSRISAFSCTPEKTLTAATETAAVELAIGKFDNPETFFSQGVAAVKPLPLIDIGTNYCSRLLILPPACGTRTPFAGGGIGLKVNAPVLASGTTQLLFAGDSAPPNVDLSPSYLNTPASNIVASLNSTVAGLHLEAYKPASGGGLGDLLVLTAGLLDGVRNILEPVIRHVLSPLLDPLLNDLLKTLGIDLINTEVGANLTCSGGRAQLVQ